MSSVTDPQHYYNRDDLCHSPCSQSDVFGELTQTDIHFADADRYSIVLNFVHITFFFLPHIGTMWGALKFESQTHCLSWYIHEAKFSAEAVR